MKYLSWAWEELKPGLEVLAQCEMCFKCMEQLQRGFEILTLGEICIEGMGAVEKGI